MYRHTQIGYVTLTSTLGVALGMAVLGTRQHRPALLALAVLLVVVGWLFSSLTIQVDDGELRSHFGPGFWRKRVPLADVAGADVASTRWWEGWGIRVTPRGMLYNVSGTAAVEIRRRSGTRFRLGTDQPEALLQAIRAGSAAATPAERGAAAATSERA